MGLRSKENGCIAASGMPSKVRIAPRVMAVAMVVSITGLMMPLAVLSSLSLSGVSSFLFPFSLMNERSMLPAESMMLGLRTRMWSMWYSTGVP